MTEDVLLAVDESAEANRLEMIQYAAAEAAELLRLKMLQLVTDEAAQILRLDMTLLTVEEAAEVLRLSPKTVYKLLHDPRHPLPHHNIHGTGYRFTRGDIERILADGERGRR